MIVGILAIAVPSYLGFKDRANNRAAQADVRAAIPSAEAYYAGQSPSTYTGISQAAPKAIDSGLSSSVVAVATNGGANYCIGATVGNKSWSVEGPCFNGNSGGVAGAPRFLETGVS